MPDKAFSSYARIVDTPAITKTLVWLSLFGSLAIGLIFWISNGIQETSISLFTITGISLGLILLQHWGLYQLSAFILYVVVSIILTFNISIGHAIYDEGMLAFPLLIVFSGLIFGKRSVVIVTFITVLELVLVYILADAGHLTPFEGSVNITLVDTNTTLIILIATGMLVWVVIDIIESAVDRIIQSEHDLEDAYDLTLAAWAKALELREREDPGHSKRVTSLAVLLAERLGLDQEQIKHIQQGALLHDIGKMGIPERILLKDTDLDEEEKMLLEKHPMMAAEIVAGIDYLEEAKQIITHHHERYDGSGYPGEVVGPAIPIGAQIFSVVDNWDMLRTARPCKDAWTDEMTLKYIQDQSGRKFNPEVVDIFLKMISQLDLKDD
jgi:putative nucleotidyltransferase with HDIG domain